MRYDHLFGELVQKSKKQVSDYIERELGNAHAEIPPDAHDHEAKVRAIERLERRMRLAEQHLDAYFQDYQQRNDEILARTGRRDGGFAWNEIKSRFDQMNFDRLAWFERFLSRVDDHGHYQPYSRLRLDWPSDHNALGPEPTSGPTREELQAQVDQLQKELASLQRNDAQRLADLFASFAGTRAEAQMLMKKEIQRSVDRLRGQVSEDELRDHERELSSDAKQVLKDWARERRLPEEE
jgi:hypothetical protein